jgi:iron complex outermembrane recepter protein
MFRRSRVSLAAALAVGGVAMLATSGAFAQDSGQRVEVTGSRIKRTDAETASPVQVITREELDRSGKSSIQDVLRSVTSDSNGSIPTSFSNGFASGSAAISLRGLGVNSTLVLINGRRMSTYGLADDGVRTFVDLNSIPLEAVEQVEVFKGGASAIYGADAVGGVVNIKLKKNYTGATIGGSYGQTGKSDGQTTRAFGSVGFGNLDTDKFNIFATIEASKQKNIWSKDRGFIGETDLRSFNYYDLTNGAPRRFLGALTPTGNSPYGVVRNLPVPGAGTRTNIIPCDASLIDPETGLCRYNGLVEQEVQPQIERLNLFTRGTLQFSPSLTAYMELGYFNTKTKANGTLGANNDGGVFNPSDPANPLVFHDPMILPGTHPDNPTPGTDRVLLYRPNELGGRDQKTDNEVLRIVQGLEGTAFGWDFDIGALYVRSKLKNQNTGFIRYDVMQNALNNGTFRFPTSLGGPSPTDPAVLAAISPTLENNPVSSVKAIDFKVSRNDLATLPGGGLGLALGAEVRWEYANSPPVPFTDTSEIVGLGFSAFSQKRRVAAVYGELSAPVFKWLELNGALRYDRYSDFGGTTNPGVGFKLKPIDQFAVRGAYSESFRAPGPAETGGSSFGFTSIGILSQGNPNLKPETAKSWSLGVIVEPVPNTSLTVDYWQVKRKDEIIQADPNAIIPAGQCLALCDGTGGNPDLRNQPAIPGLAPNTFLYYDSAGNLTITGFFVNAAKTKTDGVDAELRHRMSLGEAGRLSAQLNWSHTNKLERTDVNGVTLDYAGTHGPLVASSGTGSPKDRATFSLTWDRGPFAVTGSINYVGPIKMVDHKGETTPSNGDGTMTNPNTGVTYPDNGQYDCGVFDVNGNVYGGCKLPAFTTFDLFAKWSPTKSLDINFSIQNVFDKKPPFDPYLAVPYGINYNQGWHQSGAVGRFFTVGARYSF